MCPDSDPEPETTDAAAAARERADLQAASDARATRLLIRIGIVAMVALLIWMAIVIISFGR
jgi:hypothetical protein